MMMSNSIEVSFSFSYTHKVQAFAVLQPFPRCYASNGEAAENVQ
jgi:hypothetical protein